MNRVFLIGRLTRDPEMRTTTSGIAMTTFGIAVQQNFTNQAGERGVDFFNIVTWRKQAENVSKYCTKGQQVAIEGRLQTREYDAQDGTKKRVTEVVADNVTFLGSKGSSNNDFNQTNTMDSGYSQDIATTDITEDPFKDFGNEVELSDDDLPF